MKRRTFLTAAGSGAVMTALPIAGLGTNEGWQTKVPLFDEIERSPPHNFVAEKRLLGCILNDNRAYNFVSDFLRPEHFFHPPFGRLFDVVAEKIERGQVADLKTLNSYLMVNGACISGPVSYTNLMKSTVTVVNKACEYGRIIHDLYIRRELIALCEDVANRASRGDEDETANMQIEYAEQSLYDLATMGEYEGGFQPFKEILDTVMEAVDTVYKRKDGLASVATGFCNLDTQLGGLHPSELVVMAGRSAMDKGPLACDFAYNAAYNHHHTDGRRGSVVGLFSLSMSAEQVAIRILSKQSNVPIDRMRKGKLTNEEFNRLGAASTTLRELPIFIDATPTLTMSALRTRARRLKRQHNLGLVVVDYLKRITLPTRNEEKRESDQTRMIVAQNLKILGTELDVPVLVMDIVD